MDMVLGSNLVEPNHTFFFCQNSFLAWNGKVIETLAFKGQLGGLQKWSWKSHWM